MVYSRASQPEAREAVLCGPQGLFARLISSWKGLLSFFWQIKRSKPKPSSDWFSWNQFGICGKDLYFLLVLTCFLGQIPVIYWPKSAPICGEDFFFWSSPSFWDRYPKYWPKWVRILYNKLAIIWSLILVKMHVARYNFSPVKVGCTSKKVGKPWSTGKSRCSNTKGRSARCVFTTNINYQLRA